MANSQETVISWTVANWITVVLMAAVFFAALGFAMKLYQQAQAKKAGTA